MNSRSVKIKNYSRSVKQDFGDMSELVHKADRRSWAKYQSRAACAFQRAVRFVPFASARADTVTA